jgi:hypothetical protein
MNKRANDQLTPYTMDAYYSWGGHFYKHGTLYPFMQGGVNTNQLHIQTMENDSDEYSLAMVDEDGDIEALLAEGDVPSENDLSLEPNDKHIEYLDIV